MSPGTETDPGSQTRPRSLRNKSTIIRFSARSFTRRSSASASATSAAHPNGAGGQQLGSFLHFGEAAEEAATAAVATAARAFLGADFLPAEGARSSVGTLYLFFNPISEEAKRAMKAVVAARPGHAHVDVARGQGAAPHATHHQPVVEPQARQVRGQRLARQPEIEEGAEEHVPRDAREAVEVELLRGG